MTTDKTKWKAVPASELDVLKYHMSGSASSNPPTKEDIAEFVGRLRSFADDIEAGRDCLWRLFGYYHVWRLWRRTLRLEIGFFNGRITLRSVRE